MFNQFICSRFWCIPSYVKHSITLISKSFKNPWNMCTIKTNSNQSWSCTWNWHFSTGKCHFLKWMFNLFLLPILWLNTVIFRLLLPLLLLVVGLYCRDKYKKWVMTDCKLQLHNHLEKFTKNISSSLFLIHVNLLHS